MIHSASDFDSTPRVITLDGGSGEGKGTATAIWAKLMESIALDAGASYRTIALFVENNPSLYKTLVQSTKEGQERLSFDLLETFKLLRLRYNASGILELNGERLGNQIRTTSIDTLVPEVSRIPVVREYVHHLLQQAAITAQHASKSVIAEGRIMGTVVFPEADLKFFFKTPIEVRAERRYLQKIKNGEDVTYEEVLRDLSLRDKKDRERDLEPLRPAEDAILIDTSSLRIEDYAGLLKEHLAKKARNIVQASVR